MVDLERLDEALLWYDETQKVNLQGWTELHWIVKAARAYRDMMTNARKVDIADRLVVGGFTPEEWQVELLPGRYLVVPEESA